MQYHFNTKCLYGNNEKVIEESTGAISFPIYQTATFAHPGVGQSTGYDYSRLQNPTREQLEKVIASLEFGYDAIAFSSGMSAASALMELFEPGSHLVVSEDLYGGTIRIFNHINKKNGIEISYVDTSDSSKIKAALQQNTKAIFIETPTNPMMHVTDLRAVSEITKEFGLLFIVDNTFLSPYFQNPINLGADIVLHSGTKFLGGHNDTIAGFLVVSNQELSDKIRFILKTTGAGLSPFDSWLILRGVKTLSIRMERQQENAMGIAQWLKSHSKVVSVYYVGLPTHPGYELNKKQSSGYGSMISFHVDSKETAILLLEKVQLIQYAESLGGVESLITYPMLQTHADVPVEEREAKGINDCFLRLSVGIEHIDDLLMDLEQAFK
ncbi:MAG: cystathionine gamma-synthase [Lachnospiraceae bacterium]|jgi:cystathionine beta-lyase/cystathionine gamma-synthase|nr:cystathionine gamma-synthase [Lachnospiraceae bacterium]